MAKKKTTKTPKFKPGDIVRVLRKAKTHERGWGNSWESTMNDAVGKTGSVLHVSAFQRKDVEVSIPGVGPSFGYPDFVLKLVSKKKK